MRAAELGSPSLPGPRLTLGKLNKHSRPCAEAFIDLFVILNLNNRLGSCVMFSALRPCVIHRVLVLYTRNAFAVMCVLKLWIQKMFVAHTSMVLSRLCHSEACFIHAVRNDLLNPGAVGTEICGSIENIDGHIFSLF